MKLPSLLLRPKVLIAILPAIILVVMTVLIPDKSINGFWSFTDILKLILIGIFSYSLIFWNYTAAQHYRLFRYAVPTIAILGALASILVIAISPSSANILVQEDHNLENIQATFLFLGSALFLIAMIRFWVKKDVKRTVLAGIFFLILFLIGMEEVSWLQPFLHTQSDAFFQKYNQQDETNFHNLNTSLSENVYYFGSFVFLVLIPFFYKKVFIFLKNFSRGAWKVATEFLPPSWFAVPFALMAGFVSPYSYQETTILVGSVLSLFILFNKLIQSIESKNRANIIVQAFCIALLFFIGVWCTFNDQALESLRAGAPKEYMENMISFGLFAYAARFYIKRFVLSKAN